MTPKVTEPVSGRATHTSCFIEQGYFFAAPGQGQGQPLSPGILTLGTSALQRTGHKHPVSLPSTSRGSMSQSPGTLSGVPEVLEPQFAYL